MNAKPRSYFCLCFVLFLSLVYSSTAFSQTLAFPGAEGFGRFAKGARAVTAPQVFIVTNLNDAGAGSFRDAVSQPGRIIVFAVGGIVRLNTDIVVAPNTTIAAQTAPGDGIGRSYYLGSKHHRSMVLRNNEGRADHPDGQPEQQEAFVAVRQTDREQGNGT